MSRSRKPLTLRQLRDKRRLTQVALAARSGLEQTHISAIELGKVRDPQMRTLEALARGLNFSIRTVAAAIEATEAA